MSQLKISYATSKTLHKTRPAARAGAAKGKGAPHQGRGRPSLWLPEPLAAERKGAPHPGKGRPSLWLPEPLRPGKAQNARCNRIRAFVEYLKTGTALNAGPAPYRAAGSLSSIDRESTDTPVQGKPSVAGTRGVLSTQSDICLQRPALPVAGQN